MTQLVLARYLPDFRGAMERMLLNAFVQGTITLSAENEARGYLMGAHLMENLSLEQVREFYGMGPVKE